VRCFERYFPQTASVAVVGLRLVQNVFNIETAETFFVADLQHRRSSARPGVGNLSRGAGQKQTQQGMAGRSNFPPTIPFPLLFMMLNFRDLWSFNQINS